MTGTPGLVLHLEPAVDEIEQAVGGAGVDELAAAGSRSGDDRRQYPDDALHPSAGGVADGARGVGLVVRVAVQRGEPGKRLVVDVVARVAGVGARRTVAGHGAVDETGVDLRHRLVVDAEALGRARSEADAHRVRCGGETVEDGAARLALEVEADDAGVTAQAVGAGVVGGEGGAPGHARRRLGDAYDVGAHIGEDTRAVPAGPHAGQVEIPNAFERACHAVPAPALSRASAVAESARRGRRLRCGSA